MLFMDSSEEYFQISCKMSREMRKKEQGQYLGW